MLSPSRRPKKCKQCKASFVPNNPLQVVCSPLCALEYAKKKRIKEEVKQVRERKQAIKTLPDFKKEAEQACHAYVRARDEGKPCISCDTTLTSDGLGGGFDAGHYRSRGAADHLRYDHARNIFGQCKRCNRYLGGNVAAMRVGMVSRIGIEQVEALESDNTAHKWTRDELIGLTKQFKEMLRELKGRK